MKIPLLKQHDPKWAAVTIGDTFLTIARWGCTICSISMASAYFNCFKLPGDLAKALSFDKQGRIIWSSIEKVFGGKFKFLTRFYSADHARIERALKNPNMVVLIEVNHAHWMLGWGKDWLRRNHYRCADPLNGKIVSTAKYGVITGGAILGK